MGSTSSGNELPAFVSVSEAARRLGISRTHLYNLRAAGSVRFSKLFGRTVVSRSEIERIIATAEGTH